MGEAKRRRLVGHADDTAKVTAARKELRPEELRELNRRLQEMVSTPEGMERFLINQFGAGNFQYDSTEGVWVIPDSKHRGPGRRFYIVRPDGSWFDAIVPERVLS
jgi:hypothetical protein